MTVGSSQNLPWPWWLAGGVGMLAAALLGARAVQKPHQGAGMSIKGGAGHKDAIDENLHSPVRFAIMAKSGESR